CRGAPHRRSTSPTPSQAAKDTHTHNTGTPRTSVTGNLSLVVAGVWGTGPACLEAQTRRATKRFCRGGGLRQPPLRSSSFRFTEGTRAEIAVKQRTNGERPRGKVCPELRPRRCLCSRAGGE